MPEKPIKPNDVASAPAAQAADALSPVKQALLEVRELRRRLATQDAERSEPIAIVGIGCRLPGGVASAEDFWSLLQQGRTAVGEIPPDRWDVEALYDADPDAPGKMYTRAGAFLDGVDQFDPYFFGIPPREAVRMDPQQRLLLEVAWETLENAAEDPTRLAGSQTGVFVGITVSDYAILQARGQQFSDIDPYLASGVAHSAAVGRLSYFFGFHGPSMAIDTACSSSLVAIHQACASLRRRECRFALAGGSQLVLVPDFNINFCKARMLSTLGACRTFDASADGYVRGEGVALIALKRLSDARADGDRIIAVIQGSAVNQDGRTTGLTVPNGPAQQAVIRQALAAAQLQPADVQYVEAHGTGTPLGDPIEVQAIAAALGEGRRQEQPVLIGSVKTNLGHLEATAGVVGVIKAALALQAGEIPAHLGFQTPNPHIDWASLPVEVATQRQPWPNGRHIAGVSSFGFSGTNAHVILGEAPAIVPVASESARATRERAVHLLPLSAKSEAALRALAMRFATYLETASAQSLADVCHTAAVGRAHFGHRAAVIGHTAAEIRESLIRLSRGEADSAVFTGVSQGEPEVVFTFTGNEVARAVIVETWKSWGIEPVEAHASAPGTTVSLELGANPLESLAHLYTRGVKVNWVAFDAPFARRKLSLPTYPFQRQRYWMELTQAASANAVDRAAYWERADAAGRRQMQYVPTDLALDSYPAKWKILERLSLAYIVEALRDLKLFARAGEVHTGQSIVATASLQPVYAKLMERWLQRLSAANLLEARGNTYGASAALPAQPLQSLRETARENFRDYPSLLEYVELSGSKLVDVLTGRESALETLFPGGASHIADGLYQLSPVARYYNEIVRAVVQSAASAADTLNVLEIGGGTGGTTSLLLPALPVTRTHYVFTDVSKRFLVQASQKFAEFPFVEYAVLDIEQPPVTQGFVEQGSDVVVAANVLHATRDLAATLRHARSLLAPGGMLVMLETTEHPIWFDISTGLIEGWQKFEDPLRATHPLLDAAQWSTLLTECGFDAMDAFPAGDSSTALLGQRVIIARSPAVAGLVCSHSRLVDSRASIAAASVEQNESSSLRAQLDAASPNARLEMLADLVSAEVGAVLGLDAAHRPGREQRLMEFGVDSLMAVDLRNRLARRLSLTRKLTATLIFDYPTVAAIASHLADEMLGRAASPRADAVPLRRVEPTLAASAIEQMDEDAAEALLLEKLQRL